jgi:type VI secretion system Hcp family effector
MKVRKLWISFLLISAFLLSASFALADITTLVIDGITGPDRDPRGNECIMLYGLGFNVNNTLGMPTGGGGGAARAEFQPIQALKRLDVTSPKLFIWVANGSHIPEATIKFWKIVDNEYISYFSIKLRDVSIASMSTTGGQGQEALLELISLSFSRIELTATPIGADGKPGAEIVTSWDLETNQEL